MNTDSFGYLSLRHWLGISAGLLLIFFCAFYFFQVSAQTESAEKPAAQNLVNGKLAFTRRLAGRTAPEGRVITANPDGTGRTTLTTPTEEDMTQPAWSPDGAKIAFSSIQRNDDLYVMNAAGGGVVNLTNTGSTFSERNASWSATGKIAYERSANSQPMQIWLINPDGTGNAHFSAITQPRPAAPAWSPDGAKLAFSSNGEIWVINSDGTNELRLTNTAVSETDPAWSPDGAKIVFRKANDIAVMNADGTNQTTVATFGSSPSWSPDGTKIAFARDGVGNGVVTMDTDGSNQVVVAVNTTSFPLCCDVIYEHPTWQPFAQVPNTFSISGRITDSNLSVSGAIVNLTGTTNATTTTDAQGNYQFSGLPAGSNYTVTPATPNYLFTPASRTYSNLSANQIANFEVRAVCVGNNRCVKNGKVAFVHGNEIFTINPDGTNQLNITNNAAIDGEPNFSPFGTSLLFTTNRDGNNEIYRMNADGSNPARLTSNAASDNLASHSPDGASIVFVSSRDGNSEIYKMNADGSNQVRLTNDAESDTYPAFSPDGQKIIFISRRLGSQKIFSMNADGSNQQLLSDAAGFSPNYFRLSYSPDGSKIIFSFTPDGSTTHPTIWTVNADGTNRTSFAFGINPTFSADGTKASYVCCFGEPLLFPARLRVLNLPGGAEQILSDKIFNSDPGFPSWQPLPLTRKVPFDYDGDNRADVSVFRQSENKWYILQSSTVSVRENIFALAGDVPAPADYDGDGKTDVGVFRPSSGDWWYLSSINNAQVNVRWGQSGDIPRPSDFDGDGRADFVVYRPSNGVWYRFSAVGQTSILAFGIAEDKPLVGDFDGDGRSDPAVFRPSTGDWWYAASSQNNQHRVLHWGASGDVPVPADYDGDGKTDFVVFRPSNGGWYILRSGEQNYTILQFGLAEDKPVAADYDGDGKADIAVFRPSTGVWYLLQTTAGFGAVHWGGSADVPTQNAFLP